MPTSPNSSDDLQWFTIQTRPRWEKLVHDALKGKGYNSFLPVYTSRRRWSDRVKELELPLFSGYLFCRLNLEERRVPLLTTPGVRQFVGIGRTPVPVPDSEIDAVRTVVASGLAAQPWPFLRLGHRVRIRGGSLDGVEGILVACRKRHRLIVSVQLLQRSVSVEVDQAWVDAAAPFAHSGIA